MNYLPYITAPLIGALIGYFTNWLAIKMLFRPLREHRLFGRFKLPFTPGLIPRERERLTLKIAETVSVHVLTPEVLAKELSGADYTLPDITVGELLSKAAGETDNPAERLIERLKAFCTEKLDGRLTELLRKAIDDNFGKLAGMFIDHQKAYDNIKEGLFAYISEPANQQAVLDKKLQEFAAYAEGGEKKAAIRRAFEQIAAYVAGQIQVKTMIEDKLNAFGVEEAEELILSVVSRELKVITVLGGVLGFIIGLLSLLPNLLQ